MRPRVYLHTLIVAGFFMTVSYSRRPPFLLQQQARQEDSLVGNWTGTSICQIKNSSCRDENVVFHILPGNGANLYKVRADKIVNGQPIDMGELDFTLDRATHTLSCTYPNGTWVLVVDKWHIDGTLTTTDKVLFRKLTLTKPSH